MQVEKRFNVKYVDSKVTFAEVPDEISLCLSISGCSIRCPDCHSKYLWENKGIDLTEDLLLDLLKRHSGITCVCLMGGVDKDILEVAKTVRREGLKVAWYTGQETLPEHEMLLNLDYIKVGPYVPAAGPLTSPTTNQKFFRIDHICTPGIVSFGEVQSPCSILEDITSKFWENNVE